MLSQNSSNFKKYLFIPQPSNITPNLEIPPAQHHKSSQQNSSNTRTAESPTAVSVNQQNYGGHWEVPLLSRIKKELTEQEVTLTAFFNMCVQKENK